MTSVTTKRNCGCSMRFVRVGATDTLVAFNMCTKHAVQMLRNSGLESRAADVMSHLDDLVLTVPGLPKTSREKK